MKKKEIKDYIKSYIGSQNAKKIISCSSVLGEKGFGMWSFKKLIFLEYCLKPYLNIILSKNNNFDHCYFVDFLSGSGANKVTGKINSIGSPIISLLKGVIQLKNQKRNNRFKKWFFIDENPVYCKALGDRVKTTIKILNEKNPYGLNLDFRKDIEIICGDCNNSIEKIIKDIKKESGNVAVFAFIDPFTFTDIEWKSWKKLLELKAVDIMFTFPINTLRRGFKRCKDSLKYLPPSLNKKIEQRGGISNIKNFGRLYAKEILKEVKRSSMSYYSEEEIAKVRNNFKKEMYWIELFTYCNPFSKACAGGIKKISSIEARHIKEIVNQIGGDGTTINDFVQKN